MFRVFVLTSVLAFALGAVVPKGFVPRLDGRIVGGEATTIEKFPHQISLEFYKEHFCGGSIISETVTVTAAHCVDDELISGITVKAGSTRLSGQGVRIAVKKIIVHEDFDYRKLANDIALLILAEPLQFSDSIKPIPLAESGVEAAVGAVAQVSGWGNHQEATDDSYDVLQYVEVNIVDAESCKRAYENIGHIISDSMICAGVPQGGKDACQGDSGGPLISEGKLVGVVSWGHGCGRKAYPGVYARVSHLRDWVEKNRPDKY